MHGPPEKRGHADHGLRVVARAEEEKALRGDKLFGEAFPQVGRGAWAAKEKAVLSIADLAGERMTAFGSPGRDDAVFPFDRRRESLENGFKLGSGRGFQEDIDGATAAKAIGDVRVSSKRVE